LMKELELITREAIAPNNYEQALTHYRLQESAPDPDPSTACAASTNAAGKSSPSIASSTVTTAASFHPTLPPLTNVQHPIWKALYIMQTCPHHAYESAVHTFVLLLLQALGFTDGYLWVFPQLSLPLCYGDSKQQAKADFTIMDINVPSFYRMAVLQDEIDPYSGPMNSEPQLIANAIAIHQENTRLKARALARKRASASTLTPPFGQKRKTGETEKTAVFNEDLALDPDPEKVVSQSNSMVETQFAVRVKGTQFNLELLQLKFCPLFSR
jgi:hypothetical protein